jgi:hypothetical protein
MTARIWMKDCTLISGKRNPIETWQTPDGRTFVADTSRWRGKGANSNMARMARAEIRNEVLDTQINDYVKNEFGRLVPR